ncbi:MAG TPA: type II secretion system F family protein [Longimicrobiales bacterium]|nr:type II secretion system F family protein [Longimicrobiales bacterium]
MSGWDYRARTYEGTPRRGVIQAATWEEANRVLVARKLIPERVKPARKDQSFRLRRSPGMKALVLFTRQFATLVRSAIPLVLTLDILQSLTDDEVLGDALGALRVDVEGGVTLAEAMRNRPRVFSPIYVNMVDAGERGGSLDQALLRLADYMERAQALRQRIRGAMIYPAVVLLVALATFVVMLLYVVPTFKGLFAASGVALPLPTLMLVRASESLAVSWVPISLAILAGTLVLLMYNDSDHGRRWTDALLLRLPILGPLIRKSAVSRFTRTTASMLKSGVSLLDTLPAAARTTDNIVLQRAIERSQSHIEQGESVHRALAETRVLPKLVARMVQVGEESGRLDEMFEKVSEFYESEVEMQVEALVKALEPALVVVVGLILGVMVITMYLPIFQIMSLGG